MAPPDDPVRDLAAWLNGRPDAAAALQAASRAAGLAETDPSARDWAEVLSEARTRGAVPAIRRALVDALGDDAALRARLDPFVASAPQGAGMRGVAVAALVAALLGVVAFAADLQRPAEVADPPPGPLDGVLEALDASPAGEAPASLAPSDPALPATPSARCPGRRGEVIGHAFAGDQKPGARGDVWLVRRPVQVRERPPGGDDGQAGGATVCELPVGTRVSLVRSPIADAEGGWWVPIVGGSLAP
jgi:hypothetical protein